MTEHRGLDHKGVMRECIQEVHFCIDDYGAPDMPNSPRIAPVGQETASARRWRTLVIDPPWSYDDKLGDGPRGAASHYGCESVDVIAKMPIGDYAEADAHMYLWTTNAFLVEAFDLMQAWGFKQRTVITWVKSNGFGLGHYFRNSTEHILFGVRGKLPLLRKDVPTHFMAPRGRHSAKPDAFYDMLQTWSPGPYLDVFARRHRMNFDVAGNEVYSAIPELQGVVK